MKTQSQKTLLIFDTHALIHRAYHALPPFRSKSGEPTGALYGLSTMILKSLKDFSPDYVVAAFDRPEPTFRHTEYKEYKAQRPKADDELIHQLERAHDVLKAFDIPIFDVVGFEADDILGTIVEQTKKDKNLKIIIVSGDADTFQLVEGDHIVVYTMRKGIEDTIIYNESKVQERFGFGPKLLPDYKGMRGDTSDNIVGVPGVGEKTATELVKYFGSLEDMYEKIEKKNFSAPAFLKPRILDLLKKHKEDALFSKKLATIRRDAPMQFSIPANKYKFNIEGAKNIFIELGFNALLRRISPEEPATAKVPQKKHIDVQGSMQFGSVSENSQQNAQDEIVEAKKDEKAFSEDIKKTEAIYVYCEDTKIYISGEKKYWICDESVFKNKNLWQEICKSKKIILPRAKPFIKLLQKNEILLPAQCFDCMLALWLCDSTFRGDSVESLFKESHIETDISDPASILKNLPRAYIALADRLKSNELENVFNEMEMPLVPILSEMETLGIAVDKIFLEKLRKEMIAKQGSFEKEIYELAGAPFNINSPLQVGELLANKLNIGQTSSGAAKKWKRTSTGRISTRESELQKLQNDYPIVRLILEYREIAKILSTYIEPLLELSVVDGRIHTTFNQEGTVTGRLSSDSPNLQNIPIRSDIGARVREAFVASPGYTLAAFDYAQIELKILASLSGDKKMIDAFKNGIDIHRMTAAEINNTSLDNVTAKMRSAAKAINFGIIYGMGVRQLGQSTGMSPQEASKFYTEYFNDFPKIRGYMDKTKKYVHEHGFVSTMFGRKRFFHLEGIHGTRFLEAEMERMAVNAIIQGTDADIMKRAMIEVHKQCDIDDVRPILQIHDEMIYEVRDDIVSKIIPKIKSIMERVVTLEAPLSVEAKIGKKWGTLENVNSHLY